MRLQWKPFDKRHDFIQHTGIARYRHIAMRRQGQPQIVIRAFRPDAPAKRRMPPVQDIAFNELMRRAKQKMVAHQLWLGIEQRHDVLELVTETEGPAGLVKAAARP